MTQIDFVIAVVLSLTIVFFVSVYVSNNFATQFDNLKFEELKSSASSLSKQLFEIKDDNSLMSELRMLEMLFIDTSGSVYSESINLTITPAISDVYVYDSFFNQIPANIISNAGTTNVSFLTSFNANEKKQIKIIYNGSSVSQITRTDSSATSSQSQSIIVRPIAVQHSDQWSLGAGSNKVSAVNEVVSDGDISYITTSSNNFVQSYNFSGSGIPSTATNIYVELHFVAIKTVSQNANIAGLMAWGTQSGRQSEGSLFALTNSYQEFIRNMTTNPHTGISWTVNDVNNWTNSNNIYVFGVKSKTGRNMRTSQIFIKIGYSIPGSSGSINTNQTMLSDKKILIVTQERCNSLQNLQYDDARNIYGFNNQFNLIMAANCSYGVEPPLSANIIVNSFPILLENSDGSITFSEAKLLVW